jgi:single-strand DNA-binding protein
MNVCALVGNLGRDPVLTTLEGGGKLTRLRLAVDRVYQDSSGTSVKETTWVPVVVWGTQAETVATHLKKGNKVAIQGRLTSRVIENGETRQTLLEVVATRVDFISVTRGGAAADSASAAPEVESE